MALPIVFSALAGPTQPLSKIDEQFAALAVATIIHCTATGTNAYTLAGITNAPAVPAYPEGQYFDFNVPNTSTGVCTVQFAALGFKKIMRANGTTQLTTGEMVAGRRFLVCYEAALDGAVGAFRAMIPII